MKWLISGAADPGAYLLGRKISVVACTDSRSVDNDLNGPMDQAAGASAVQFDVKPLVDGENPAGAPAETNVKAKQRSRRKNTEVEDDPSKRRCVSTACIACRYVTSASLW